jgi:hypothetical protein
LSVVATLFDKSPLKMIMTFYEGGIFKLIQIQMIADSSMMGMMMWERRLDPM